MPVLEEIGAIMVPVALKNINMNTKEEKPYDSTLNNIKDGRFRLRNRRTGSKFHQFGAGIGIGINFFFTILE